MYFGMKNYLKSNHNHTARHPIKGGGSEVSRKQIPFQVRFYVKVYVFFCFIQLVPLWIH